MVSVAKDQLFTIPDNLTWEQSIFIEPFANSINAWQRSNADKKNSIAVIGGGSLGMGLIACAHKFGCEDINLAELSINRRNAAISLGATQAKPNLTGSYDIVFDTVGSTQSRELAIAITNKGGSCVFLGFEEPKSIINMSEVTRHQKTLIGSFAYSRSQFVEAIELAECCKDQWVENVSFGQVEDCLIAVSYTHLTLPTTPYV